MKKIFMLLVACVAMVFVSCSKDDDENVSGGEKMVSKITTLISGGEKINQVFEYDEQGRIIKYVYDGDLSEYTYKDDAIIEKFYVDNVLRSTTTHTLKDGLIVSTLWESNRYDQSSTTSFSYDKSRHLVATEKDGQTDLVGWSNGNLQDVGSTLSFTYTEHESKSNINICFDFTDYTDFDDILFKTGYFGNVSQNLVNTAEINYYGIQQCQYEYEFDKDGCVTTIMEYRSKKLYSTTTIEYK